MVSASEAVGIGAVWCCGWLHRVEVGDGRGEHVEAGAVGADELDEGGVLAEGFEDGTGRSGQPPPVRVAQGDGVELVNGGGHGGDQCAVSGAAREVNVGGEQLRLVLVGPMIHPVRTRCMRPASPVTSMATS